MIILAIWFLNFGISWLNAWGCGKTWNETKHAGGLPHFMNWCGAIMSASGFSWCYMLILGGVGTIIPIEGEDGVSKPLLTPEMLQAFCDLGYMVLIVPILGTGIAITVHSWGVFYRNRTLANGAVAGWNTFAQVYNVASAFRDMPSASRGVGGYFGGKDSEGDKLTVGFLVLMAVAGGILTTRAIILSTARSTAFNRLHEHA